VYPWGAWNRAAASLHQKKSAEVVQASDLDASWSPPIGGNTRADPELTGGRLYPFLSGTGSETPRRCWRVLLESIAAERDVLVCEPTLYK